MRKATRNYFLAVVMFLLGLFEIVSGFVLWLVLPRGSGYMGGRGLASEATSLWSRCLACPPHMGWRRPSDYGGDTPSASLEMDSLCEQETEHGKE